MKIASRGPGPLALLVVLAGLTHARADGPADNLPDAVRRVPKLGIEPKAEDRKALEAGLAALTAALADLDAKQDPKLADLRPDVEIFRKAVADALEFRELFAPEDVRKATRLLVEGRRRAEQLLGGSAPWTRQSGLVVRGYVSKIDDSVQPYGLVVPEGAAEPGGARRRLDVWFHGRGETLSEVNFLDERMRQVGTFAPPDTIVLHPYGRYCNAFKFAGEVDVFEAIDATRRQYRVDDDRTSVRGFSMGGAAAWQFAVHDADRWFAANPGAGFCETPLFLNVFQSEKLSPPWYERTLWRLYDCPEVAANLLQCPTVAYSGELDKQKQAADVMAGALKASNVDLLHVIGPKTKHAYEPKARLEVERRMADLAERGRDRMPESLHLDTFTLKYNRMHWATIDALTQHWERATVEAWIAGDSALEVRSANVDALTFDMPAGHAPFALTRSVTIAIEGAAIEAPRPKSDRSWRARLVRGKDGWTLRDESADPTGLRKRHDLQGPIDDAFMDSFIMVRPTGTARHPEVGAWAAREFDRAVEHWRRHFRGRARVVDDSALTDDQIASANLILWGDPTSNAVLGRIADKLPIRWGADRVEAVPQAFTAEHHAPILIYPNPLNPARYVVLNSGFTFRDYDYLNNARQTPKLPDWAIVDIRTPADSRHPGAIVAAEFFGESWELKPPRP